MAWKTAGIVTGYVLGGVTVLTAAFIAGKRVGAREAKEKANASWTPPKNRRVDPKEEQAQA
jgi:hypothetical protein